MGLIRSRATLLAALLFFGGILPALEPGQLGEEIQRLEQQAARAGISSAERHDALARLAQLRQLSGNIAGAAVHWLDAAAADPSDDAALVSGAFCLAAIGEWERAALSIQPLISSGKWGTPVLQARYLDACLRALTTNDASSLASLASGPEFAFMRPAIYYTLWQIAARSPGSGANSGANSGAEAWKNRLLAEFPQSPEARSAGGRKDSPNISAVQSPIWLLLPGTAVPAPAAAARPAEAPPPPAASALQTGLFSREANARSQSDDLRKAGFAAAVSRKQVRGAEYWVVTVPAGQNASKTIADLKKAGFDSFPAN